MVRSVLVVGMLVAFAPSALSAKVAGTTLAEVVASSAIIVLGTDISVEQRGSWRIARFRVESTLKGDAPDELFYLASPTWSCDIATAQAGEQALLLLTAPQGGSLLRPGPPSRFHGETVYRIAFAGRGRLPLSLIDGETYATVWSSELQLPVELSTVIGPEPEFAFIRRTRFEPLQQSIQTMISTSGQSSIQAHHP